ncbi:MAG: DnaD domain protein, partial [Chloroflexi bacterium]|nr:DnaD domain protein [Chloroflexota bacterium]
DGFASGAPVTPLPQALLRDLAPLMSDPAELIVTLYTADGLSRVRRYPRRLSSKDLRETRAMIEALANMCGQREVDEAFADGLNLAVERGSLLRARAIQDGVWTEWIALNDADGRRALESASLPPVSQPVYGREPIHSSVPEIWQSAFGTVMPPILAEEVKSAESRFGLEWLHDAFAEAAANNVRNWRYVQAILERWDASGRDKEGRDGGDATARSAAGGLESSRYRHLFRE